MTVETRVIVALPWCRHVQRGGERMAGPSMAKSSARETRVLLDALSDFVLCISRERQQRSARNRRKNVQPTQEETKSNDVKREILDWLRGLSDGEWASLCTVVDAGFVKTVLGMGISAKGRVHPRCSIGGSQWGCIVEYQLVPAPNHSLRRSTDAGPREFVKRPSVRTKDGDVFSGFHMRAFEEACSSLLQSVRMLNVEKSCDALCVFSDRHEWLQQAEIISGRRFLLHQPIHHDRKSPPMWQETQWFHERGYFALAELILNQIEMNIWFHYSQRVRSPVKYKIPVVGIAAKEILANEWQLATATRKFDALRSISTGVTAYMQDIPQPLRQGTSIANNQQLITLLQVVDVQEATPTRGMPSRLVAACNLFSLPFERILAAPQGSAVGLLVAELLQEQCAMILSDSLSRPPARPSTSEDSVTKTTHAQRRRSARKKAAKQRKHVQDCRADHERQLRVVLGELPRVVRERNDRITHTVRDVLGEMLEAVAREVGEGNEDEDVQVSIRVKRRKKRGKKKSKVKAESVEEDARLEDAGKENLSHNSASLAQSIVVRTETSRPLLNFLATKADNASSYSSPSTTTAFSTNSFYTITSPFFLQLSSHRELTPTSGREEMDDDDVVTEAPDEASSSAQRQLVESNFDWYLPSLFSSQSSVHTTSTASSLDWDFQRWNLKADPASSAKPVVFGPHLQSPRTESPHTEAISPPQSPKAVTSSIGEMHAHHGSPGGVFPIQRFSSFVDVTSDSDPSPGTSPLSASDQACDLDNDGSPSGLRSDFLYREGGFFDRQRGSKRRHRPFPFEYDDDNDSIETGEATTWKGRLSRPPAMHSAVDPIPRTPTPCACAEAHTAKVNEVTEANERISRLEGLLEERMSTFETESSAMSSEIAGLQQQVSILTKRVTSLEKEIEDFRIHGRRPIQEERDESADLPPAPALSPTTSPSTMAPAQGYPHPIMRPGGASNYSILGPFVSVPMSVLPPRSKLHWDMCEYVSQLQGDASARMNAQMAAIRLCTGAVQSLWPRAQVRPYGSFVTRLALPTSDVDLVICLPKVRRDAPADAAGVLEGRNAIKESWQQNLARKLRQEPWVVTDSVKTIPHAAIPIITLVTTLPMNVRLDISFEGPGHNGLATNDVVLSLMQEFPPLAPIMLVLKSFVIERGFAVAYSGGLSSYALLLMVARYLQEHTDRYDNASSSPSSSCADFGMVLMGLLDFYGNRFDPRTTGISVAARCFFNRDSIAPAHHQQHHGHVHHSNVMHTSVDDAHGDQWQQMNQSSHVHNNANLLSSPGSRRHSNRSSLHDWPMQRADAIHDYASIAAHDPHKFDPLFIEDPLHLSNNVGRNCFRITQIRRAFATGYTTLMAASMSVSVFSANRNVPVCGVALHPDNILRAILGPNAPAVNTTNASATTPKPEIPQQAHQPPKARAAGATGHHRPASSGANLRYAPGIIPLYDAPYAQPPFPVTYQAASAAAPPPPYMLHRMQQQHHQQHQQQYHLYAASVSKPATRRGDVSAPVYRRHSGSVTEQMTTRSEAASTTATSKPFSKRPKQQERALDYSPRLMPPTMHRSSSIELDKKMSSVNNVGIEGSAVGRGGSTRKIPSRSMSFADVVISGAGSSSASSSAIQPDRPRKAPSSPLALVRPAKSRRRNESSAKDEGFNERLETKDDFML